MATLTGKGHYPVRVFDVERMLTDNDDNGRQTLYRERYALRSDGKVLHQIVWTEEQGEGAFQTYSRRRNAAIGEKTTRLVHSSGYAIKAALKRFDRDNAQEGADRLRAVLVGRGYTVVSER